MYQLPRFTALDQGASWRLADGGDKAKRRRHLLAPCALFAMLTCGIIVLYRSAGGESFHRQEPPYSHFSRPALSDRLAVDLSLNASTCAAEFPAFYPQLEANAKHWILKGGISKSLVDTVEGTGRNDNSRIVTHNGQLFIRTYKPDWQSRTRALLRLIDMALQGNPSEDGVMPAIDIAFSLGDKDGIEAPGWVLDRPYDAGPGQWLLPDFSFAAWPEAGVPSYQEFRNQAVDIEKSHPWESKGNKVFFRGDPSEWKARLDLMERTRAPGASSWADVKRTTFWGAPGSPIVPMPDHCLNKYLIHSEGNSYSGRAKYLYNCRSAVIQHKLVWREHWHDALISDPADLNRNTIELEGPYFNGLRETMLALQSEDATPTSAKYVSTGERIAASAHRILHGRYLTPAATACYIRAAIRSYASAQSDEQRSLKAGGGVAPGAGLGNEWHSKVHGDVSYETWLQLGQLRWPPE